MAVQDVVRTVTIPRQGGPAEPPLLSPGPAAAPVRLLGRDRPLTPVERQFGLGLLAMLLVLETIILVGLLLAT